MSPRTCWLAALVPASTLLLPVTSGAAGAEARPGEREYVVAFDPTMVDLGAGSGLGEVDGTVVDVNPQLGVALVRSAEAGFLSATRGQPGVRGVAYNQAVGTSRPGMPHRLAPEAPSHAERRRAATDSERGMGRRPGPTTLDALLAPSAEPLAHLQWNMAMIGATADEAHGQLTGAGVDVGIIDTGIDSRHPDIAPNYDAGRSRNFTVDRPDLDGPCEQADCVDPTDGDGRGHGTHVAGVVAAARNGFGLAGVAPDARLVSLRAGQDSGYFFLYETADALTAAGDLGLDVVNMSFYTDPWLYNCDSRDDYVSGDVSDEDLAQQALARQVIGEALEYAHERGVTLVAAAGNEHTDLAAPHRTDPFVPGSSGANRTRTVTRDCVNLPSEGPHVISVGAVGPSGTKADYSNYGYGSIALTAPGGWIRDRVGTADYESPGNLVLSTYPEDAAQAQGFADRTGVPADPFSVRWCSPVTGVCGFYTYLQGSSMASPHVAGVAALVVQRDGVGNPVTGYTLDPDVVAARLAEAAADQPCPADGAEDYTQEGRPAEWNAACTGSAAVNGLYGEGIVSASRLLRRT